MSVPSDYMLRKLADLDHYDEAIGACGVATSENAIWPLRIWAHGPDPDEQANQYRAVADARERQERRAK